MKLYAGILILMGAVLGDSGDEDTALGIMGGEFVNEGELPYMALIFVDFPRFKPVGPGVITAPNIVTTSAGVCKKLRNRMDSFRVAAGITRILDAKNSKYQRKIINWEFHPRYDPKTLDYNICRLFLDNKLELNDEVNVAQKCDFLLDRNERCFVAGWGSIRKDGFGWSNSLKKLNASIVDQFWCMHKYRETATVTRRMICAGGKEDEGACVGDGGGPLICYPQNSACLRGIISWGPKPCGQWDLPFISSSIYDSAWFLKGY